MFFINDSPNFGCVCSKLETFKQGIQQIVWQKKELYVEAFSKLKLLKTVPCVQEDFYLYKSNGELKN